VKREACTLWSVMLAIALLLPCLSRAQAAGGGTTTSSGGTTLSAATCPDANFFGGAMFGNLCWSCFFPVVIEGFPIGDGPLPSDTAFPECICPGKTMGIPSLGTVVGLWEPAHLFEIVRQPWCSPIFGQPLMDSSIDSATSNTGFGGLSRWGGYNSHDAGDDNPTQDSTFYNFHWWIYPVNMLVDALVGSDADKHEGQDLDIAYISEIDPTWINDEMAFYTQPEAKLFANPIAIAACAMDAVASTVAKPLKFMYWCAGTWGHAYPFTGNVNNNDDPERNASLVTFRALAALSRRTLARKTYGDDSTCADSINPMIQKQEYRLQTFYPVPEKSGNHWLGASVFDWGEWRNIPFRGEDFIIAEWRYTEYCEVYW